MSNPPSSSELKAAAELIQVPVVLNLRQWGDVVAALNTIIRLAGPPDTHPARQMLQARALICQQIGIPEKGATGI